MKTDRDDEELYIYVPGLYSLVDVAVIAGWIVFAILLSKR
ncbi:hypothetical protein CP488_01731 [Chthonomonas calidirosea]|nr:hypothetical protein CP488_01731 [Chthonomonas calidirosea]